MRLAVLFWCYHALDLCVERVRDLRDRNPGTPLYVLFGGPLDKAAAFEAALGPLSDDFYAFPQERSGYWKWYHGDLMLADWHLARGRDLAWDAVFVAQWDLVVSAPLAEVCAGMREDELALPGLRSIRDVYDWWYWTRPGSEDRDEYHRFVAALAGSTGFDGEALGCQFVFACLPRRFLEAYATRPDPMVGFLEYTIPTCARAWGFGFHRSRHYEARWRRDPTEPPWRRLTCTLSTEKQHVPFWMYELHRLVPKGQRIVHPYNQVLPRGPKDRARRFVRSLARSTIDECKRLAGPRGDRSSA